MIGATCQFCGKPLWRIRRGGDGQFCCQEHRDRFRLRRGLDRIMEAGESAARSRRREQPNIAALQRAALPEGAGERREYPGKNPVSHKARDCYSPSVHLAPTHFRVSCTPLDRGPVLLPPPQTRRLILAPRFAPNSRLAFPIRDARPLPTLEKRKPMQKWAPRNLFPGVSLAAGAPRLAEREPRASRLPVLPAAGAVKLAGLGESVTSALETAARAAPERLLVPAGRGGGPAPPVRVSHPGLPLVSCVALVQPVRSRRRVISGAALAGSGRAHICEPRAVPLDRPPMVALVPLARHPLVMRAARPRCGPALAAAFVSRAGWRAVTPPSPASKPEAMACGALPTAVRPGYPRVRHAAVPRLAAAEMASIARTSLRVPAGEARACLETRGRSSQPARILERRALPGLAHVPSIRFSGFRPVSFGKAEVVPGGRAAQVAFFMHECFFPLVSFGILGTFEQALGQRAVEAAVRLEENFENGLTRWSGGTADWRVDVAGVRVGSLALLRPSLSMRDYEMQFLARVERHGLGWVFRASGPDNYYAVKLVVSAGESPAYELVRYGVFQGQAETPVRVPLTSLALTRSALNVRTAVAGDTFSVTIDGAAAATWEDGRLTEGGIGFFAEREYPARLYWVRLEPC